MADQTRVIMVKERHYQIFMAIFSREPQDMMTFRFDSFVKAMAAANFGISQAHGSGVKFTLYQPTGAKSKAKKQKGVKSVTIHENHGTGAADLTRIEILHIRDTLDEAYDWHVGSFSVAS